MVLFVAKYKVYVSLGKFGCRIDVFEFPGFAIGNYYPLSSLFEQIIGTRGKSWEDADRNAMETAAKSHRDIRVAEVVEQDMQLETAISSGFWSSLTFRLSLKTKTNFEVGTLVKTSFFAGWFFLMRTPSSGQGFVTWSINVPCPWELTATISRLASLFVFSIIFCPNRFENTSPLGITPCMRVICLNGLIENR
jgi:dodecin